MYLKSFTIKNFRKFGTKENKVNFAYAKLKEVKGESSEQEINISATSTLIIGQNNIGKTSVISALKNVINPKNFSSTDFNFKYLNKFLDDYISSDFNKEIDLPVIEFQMELEIDDENDIIVNIAPLLDLKNTKSATVYLRIQLKEAEEFREKLQEKLRQNNFSSDRKFKQLLKIINEVGLECIYLNKDGQEITDFRVQDLIEIKSIEANKITNENSLTKSFNKIIKYRHNHKDSAISNSIDTILQRANEELNTEFKESHEDAVNDALNEIEHEDKLAIKLSSDLTHEKLLEKNILLYEYAEEGLAIPERQYGLGYTNLVMILAEIIEYIEKSPEDSFTSGINIISIEEPETYMHPQMQELFIKNINKAIEKLLESKEKHVNCQIIITTHSSHILNSKIHSGNSFDHISYLTTTKQKETEIVNLNDKTIIQGEQDINELGDKFHQLEFLKKHIKYKVSELFFSDAVIFVEGVTEETLLRYWIDEDDELKRYYISIFNIDGAHGLVYHHLIGQLKIPSLIITDLDIQIEKEEKKMTDSEKYPQVSCLENRKTTNATIKKYYGENLGDIKKNPGIVKGNLIVAFQDKIGTYYPTSFEEALILTNYDNDILKNALKKTKPRIYAKYHKGKDENLKKNSRVLQHKLSSSKSEFSNRLLLELVSQPTQPRKLHLLTIPNYIEKELVELRKMLNGVL
ncbi:MAG TPA: AAA family ATPase [Tissierellaceae bacterium]